MHTLVGRVVVHITHHKDLHVLVDAKETVLDCLGLTSSRLTVERARESARPVAHDDCDILASQLATNSEETTGIISAILCLLLNVWHQLHILHGEESRIVEQGTVDTTAVRTLDMAVLHATSLERCLSDEVIEHLVVLHLSHADEGAAHLRQLIRTHVGKGTSHVVQLVGVLHAVPSLGRQILIVVLALIVASIEEILLVVEAYGIEIESFLPLGKRSQADYQQGGEHQKLFLHYFSFYLFYLRICRPMMFDNTLSNANIGILSEKTAYFIKI